MKYAVIDVGSNSVRMTAYRYDANAKKLTPFLDQREMIYLAAHVKEQSLNEIGIQKLALSLKKYKSLLSDLQIEHYYVIATASIRNVKNAMEIVAQIDAMTGMRMQILSGEEEAKLDFRGVMQEIPEQNGMIIDIGGGSTELIFFEDRELVKALSIPIGSLQLTANYVSGIIPTHKERKAIKRQIDAALNTVVWNHRKFPMIYGIGGTCRAALKLSREVYAGEPSLDEYGVLALDAAEQLLDTVKEELHAQKEMPVLKQIYRTVPERMFSMLPGLMLLHRIAARVQAKELQVCMGSVREGYLYQNVLKLKESYHEQ